MLKKILVALVFFHSLVSYAHHEMILIESHIPASKPHFWQLIFQDKVYFFCNNRKTCDKRILLDVKPGIAYYFNLIRNRGNDRIDESCIDKKITIQPNTFTKLSVHLVNTVVFCKISS